jgi:hypothetical protein
MIFYNERDRRDPRDHPNIVFVFGSNLSGAHGAGAAAFARFWYGAVYGVGVGRTGQSYALPTKDEDINTLPLDRISGYVTEFLDYAREHSNEEFFVTRVGCGLAGYTDEQIAPMFRGAPDNCVFEQSWKEYLT